MNTHKFICQLSLATVQRAQTNRPEKYAIETETEANKWNKTNASQSNRKFLDKSEKIFALSGYLYKCTYMLLRQTD